MNKVIGLTQHPQINLIRAALKKSGRRIFLVGGALRDYYLNRQGSDLDFAVNGDAIKMSRRLARTIKGAFVLLDEEHGSARVVKTIEGKIWTFDFTDWRGPSIQKDLNLRDFTINALAWDIEKKDQLTILDLKDSMRDLKSGTVRMVSSKAFEDDPLRLLRAFTLQATFGFNIEPKTMRQIKKDIHLISSVAAERMREEIFKILESPRAYEVVNCMDRVGLLPRVIPQIAVMKGIKQGGYHHLDVWQHSLEVLAQLEKIIKDSSLNTGLNKYLNELIGGAHSRGALLKMSALLHDIGKPETLKKEGTKLTFHTHEHKGAAITRQIARQLKLSVKERYFLEDAVRLHLRPGYLSNFKRPSEKAIFRYMRDTKDEAASLALLAMADQAATRGPLTTKAKERHHANICQHLIDQYFKLKNQTPQKRLITGDDLIKNLKLEPSKIFGKILAQVEEAAALGKITTKAQALTLARGIIQS